MTRALRFVLFLLCACARTPRRPATVHFLDQGWSERERATFHHRSEGTHELPLAWFFALERTGSSAAFAEDLSRFGLIEDDTPLPIGLAIDASVDPPQVGLTCAACHTAELTLDDAAIRIEGGGARADIGAFVRELYVAMLVTAGDPVKLRRFATRVLGEPHSGSARHELARALRAHARRFTAPTIAARMHGVPTTEGGPGRLDAFGHGANRLLGRTGIDYGPTDAPADFPSLWGTPQLEWLEYNGAVRGLRGRNVLQALLVGATTIDRDALAEIEALLLELRPPSWPEALLGKPDAALVESGRAIYVSRCSRCHEEVRMVPLERIGTDPRLALGFARRRVRERTLAEALAEIVALEIRAPLAYRAVPLAGVWATAPYLHNGSVATLYELLSPARERRVELDPRARFDPEEVGLAHGGRVGQRNVRAAGNSNAGHEFRDGPRGPGVLGPTIPADDRRALVEYLKTL